MSAIISAIFALANTAFGIWLNRKHRLSEQLATSQANTISRLAEDNHKMELRVVALETRMHSTKNDITKIEGSLADITDSMARRQDVESLRELILKVLAERG